MSTLRFQELNDAPLELAFVYVRVPTTVGSIVQFDVQKGRSNEFAALRINKTAINAIFQVLHSTYDMSRGTATF